MILLTPIEPVEQQPEWDYEVTLDDAVFRLLIQYRYRTDSWYLSIYTADGICLKRQKRLVIDYPIHWRYKGEDWPAGFLVLLDVASTGEECGYADLGSRCQLAYFEAADLEAPETVTESLAIVAI